MSIVLTFLVIKSSYLAVFKVVKDFSKMYSKSCVDTLKIFFNCFILIKIRKISEKSFKYLETND